MEAGQPLICIPAYEPSAALERLVSELSAEHQGGIVVVNDGSSSGCRAIFEAVAKHPGVTVLEHGSNLGKGQALKTAFSYFLSNSPADCLGVVTADADGQHAPEDILKVCGALMGEPDHLHLGVRQFDRDVPFRSRLGNVVSRQVFKTVTGAVLSDTQTGLRGIPRALLPELAGIPLSGYQYELEMLLRVVTAGVKINEITIRTIYEAGNAGSHFNPLVDSLRVYLVFLRFVVRRLPGAAKRGL